MDIKKNNYTEYLCFLNLFKYFLHLIYLYLNICLFKLKVGHHLIFLYPDFCACEFYFKIHLLIILYTNHILLPLLL